MKKFCRAFAVFFLVGLLGGAADSRAFAVEIAQRYEMGDYGVSVGLPQGWLPLEDTLPDGSDRLALMNPSTSAYTITVTMNNDTKPDDVVVDHVQAQKLFSKDKREFQMIAFEETKLSGRDAVLVEYAFDDGGSVMLHRKIMYFDGKKSVVVTSYFDVGNYIDFESELAAYLQIVEAVEQSVVLSK